MACCAIPWPVRARNIPNSVKVRQREFTTIPEEIPNKDQSTFDGGNFPDAEASARRSRRNTSGDGQRHIAPCNNDDERRAQRLNPTSHQITNRGLRQWSNAVLPDMVRSSAPIAASRVRTTAFEPRASTLSTACMALCELGRLWQARTAPLKVMTSRKQFAFSNSPPNQKSRDTCSRFERAATTSLEATVAGFHLGCRLPPRPSLAGVDCGAEVTTSRELRTCRKSPSNCTGRDTCSRFAQASTKALEVAAVNFHLTCRPCPDSSR